MVSSNTLKNFSYTVLILSGSLKSTEGKIRVLLEHIKDTQSLYASFFNFIGKMWGTN